VLPFASLATRGWAGPAALAADFLAEEVLLLVEAVPFHLPGAVALAWERRDDLRRLYPLDSRASVEDCLAWALTAGIAEGELDPAWIGPRCLASLVAPAAVGALHGDVPITEGMRMLRGADAARGFLPHWQSFPADRLGRLAQGLWYALLAPHRFGWPAAMVAPVRAYFAAPSGIAAGGHALNRAGLALWELRADLQADFPLDSEAGVCGFLLWLLQHGLPELALPLAVFDPALEAALRRPVAPHGLPGVLDLLYRARADLRAAFAPGDVAGLRAWAEAHVAQSYAGTMLDGLYEPSPSPSPSPPPVPMPRRAAIGLTGQLTAASGRGEDVRTAAAALRAAGCVDFLLIDRDSDAILDAEGRPLPPGTPVELAVNLVFLNADTAVADWRALRTRGVVARRSIGCWAWELARLPAAWRHGFAFYDEIWAASAFAAEAFAAEALRPVRQVPPAVILPAPAPVRRRPDAPTRFLFAFDYRSYIARKNPEAVIAAFHRAFPAAEPGVRLRLKTQGAAAMPEAAARLAALCQDPRIELIDASLSRDAMLALLAECDAFVSLHRSEGFGRAPAEAMWLGRPVILTGYAGTADFATPDCAYVIDHALVPVPPGTYPGAVGQFWAEPDIAMAAAALRAVHERPAEARAIGARAARRIRALYAPAVAGRAMLAALDV
jgi:glycosyltransferase involved in cell wall biosynthesis